MLGFVKSFLGFGREDMTSSEFDYTVDLIESSSRRASYNENIRNHLLEMSRRVEYALMSNPQVFTEESKLRAIKALNKAKDISR